MRPRDYLWLLIPVGILALIIASFIVVGPGDVIDGSYDPRIENCGPGGTWCL